MAASFTDLMASMMVIFILLFVVYSNNVAQSKRDTTHKVLEELKNGLAKAGMDTSQVRPDPHDRYAVLVVMPSSLLFERGSSDVLEAGQRYLGYFAPVFARILCDSLGSRIESVVVQGHTDTTYVGASSVSDDTPLSERGRAYNLALSQNRSMAVVQTCLKALRSDPDRPAFLRLLSASGRGQEELLPEYPDTSMQQRRVVFKVRVQVDSLNALAAKLPPESAAMRTTR
jgi:outer membrane protein OmpA-like peptidoglycan-associated protein